MAGMQNVLKVKYFQFDSFPLRFVCIYSSLLLLSYGIPSQYYQLLRDFISTAVVCTAYYGGLAAQKDGDMAVLIEGIRFTIVSECMAIGYIIAFSAAVLAYPSSVREKGYGIIAGVFFIMLLNILRIVFLGWTGGNYPQYFRVVHNYLWEGLFAVAVVSIWVAWTNSMRTISHFSFRKMEVNRHTKLTKVPIILLSAGSIYALSGIYLAGLAAVSNLIMNVLDFKEALVRTDGNMMYIIISGSRMISDVSAGIYYLLPFIVLSVIFPRSSAINFGQLFSGAVLLSFVQIINILLLAGASILYDGQMSSYQSSFLGAVPVVSGIGLWWSLRYGR